MKRILPTSQTSRTSRQYFTRRYCPGGAVRQSDKYNVGHATCPSIDGASRRSAMRKLTFKLKLILN